MNVFIVHAHPEPRSFNGALTRKAVEVLEEEGHAVRVSDLHAMGFDPVSDRRSFITVKDPDYFKQQQEERYAAENGGFAPDIKTEMEKLNWCDLLILQFPINWFSVPAMLKGWIDRVLAMGYAYDGGRRYEDGALQGKRAMVGLTTGGGEVSFSERGLAGDIEMLLYPLHHGTLRFCGFTVLPPFISWSPARVGGERRQGYLEAWGDRLRKIDRIAPIEYLPLSAYTEERILRDEADLPRNSYRGSSPSRLER